MFNHIMVGSSDIERSKKFYDAVLGVIGAPEGVSNTAPTGQVRVAWRHNGGAFMVSQPINDKPASYSNGGTIAFKCATPEQVKQFHDIGVKMGGTSCEDPPGPRGTAGVHLSYVRDPDGHKLCALYRPAV